MAVDCTRKENNVVHLRREVLGPFNRVFANIVSSKSSGLFRFQTTSELVFSPATHKDTTATKRERMLEVKKGRVENAASGNFLSDEVSPEFIWVAHSPAVWGQGVSPAWSRYLRGECRPAWTPMGLRARPPGRCIDPRWAW